MSSEDIFLSILVGILTALIITIYVGNSWRNR